MVLCKIIIQLPMTLDETNISYKMDSYIWKVINYMKWRCKERKKIPTVIKDIYFSISDEEHIYAERVVISVSLQNRILMQFHIGHSGISWMKCR